MTPERQARELRQQADRIAATDNMAPAATHVRARYYDAATAIEALSTQLRTIATHWPGRWTGYCMGCDDTEWPCQTVLDVVVPWMEPEEVPE